jgi:hypothetical protein
MSSFSTAQATANRDGKNWYSVLNYDPRNRVAAGMGTEIIQENQEDFMQKAWFQLQQLKQAQNHLAAIGSIMERFNVRLRDETLVSHEEVVSMSRGMTSRVILSGTGAQKPTVLQNLTVSVTPNALINSATKRLVRINGKVAKRIETPASTQAKTSNLKIVNTTLSANNGAVLMNYRLPYLKDFVLFDMVIVGVDPNPQPLLDAALGHFRKRIPSLASPPLVFFNFNQARQNITTAMAQMPMKMLGTKINLPANQATVMPKPPSEFIGQPVFKDAMYQFLWKKDKEWLIPNVHLIENNTVTLLENNIPFIHAYMLGVNQELAHEMLWRSYPADLSATFFRHFWDNIDENQFDIDAIKTWIGVKAPERMSGGASKARLVLTIRGELLLKFPNTIVFAALATKTANGKLSFSTEGVFKLPKFKADVPPDLQFMGFDLTVNDILNPAPNSEWYFVFMEPVGEPRFGLDATFKPANAAVYSRNDLSWEHLKNPNLPPFITASNKPNMPTMPPAEKNLWGKNAAAMAALLFQQPYAHFVKASDMLNIKK